MDTEKRIQDLENRLKKIEDVLFGMNDDVRFKAKVRKHALDGTTTAGLPILVDTHGTRWSVTNVTKL